MPQQSFYLNLMKSKVIETFRSVIASLDHRKHIFIVTYKLPGRKEHLHKNIIDQVKNMRKKM